MPGKKRAAPKLPTPNGKQASIAETRPNPPPIGAVEDDSETDDDDQLVAYAPPNPNPPTVLAVPPAIAIPKPLAPASLKKAAAAPAKPVPGRRKKPAATPAGPTEAELALKNAALDVLNDVPKKEVAAAVAPAKAPIVIDIDDEIVPYMPLGPQKRVAVKKEPGLEIKPPAATATAIPPASSSLSAGEEGTMAPAAVTQSSPVLKTPPQKKPMAVAAVRDPLLDLAGPMPPPGSKSSFASPKQVESAMGARDRRAATAARDTAFRSVKNQAGLAGIEGTGLFLNSFPLSSIAELFRSEADAAASAAAAAASSSTQAPIEPHHQDLRRFNTGLDKFASGAMAMRAYNMQQKAAEFHGPPAQEYRYPLTSAHVRDSLVAPHSELSGCNSSSCIGTSCEERFTLVEYLTPAQLEHWRRTRCVPTGDRRLGMCYLCMLRIECATAGLAACGQFNIEVGPEFYHMVNMPGGYVPEAMDTNAMSGHCAGVTAPFRRFSTADYVHQVRPMWVLKRTSHSAGEGPREWAKQNIKGYGERASLIYNAAPCPSTPNSSSAVSAVAYSNLPSCEDLIFRAMVPESKLTQRKTEDLCLAQEQSPSMGGWQVSLREFFGGPALMPETIDVCTPAASTQEMILSLTFADPPVALGRLVAMVIASGDNLSMVLERMGFTLAGMEFLKLGADSRSRFQASKPFGDHLLFYMMCARLNETVRLLSFDVPPVEIGGDVLAPSGAMIALMANHGIRRRMTDYHYAMRPIIEYYEKAMKNQQSFDDSKMFQTNPASGLLLYIELRPMPPPT